MSFLYAIYKGGLIANVKLHFLKTIHHLSTLQGSTFSVFHFRGNEGLFCCYPGSERLPFCKTVFRNFYRLCIIMKQENNAHGMSARLSDC